jgi:hypothetical protein
LLKFFAVIEDTAGTWKKIVGADAAKVLKVDMGAERERHDREDSRQTRSLLERIQGRATVPWSVESYVIPSGAAGTPPDVHALLKAALGAHANTPLTSDVYSLANVQTIDTLTLLRHLNDVYSESVWGAWVDELTLSIQGGDQPKFKFAGQAMGFVSTGTSTLNGDMVASTTMVAETVDENAFSVNSLVQIGATANVAVTVDTSRPSFTVDASVTESDEDPVIPYSPAETTAGSPVAGISGSITYDSDSVKMTGLELSLKNNFRGHEDEALEEYPSDVVPGYREVGGQITMRMRKDFVQHLVNRRSYDTVAATVVLGSIAGRICTVSLPQIEIDYSGVEVPAGDGDVVFTLPFRALSSAEAAEDELTITFT